MSYSCTSLLTSMVPNIYVFTSTDSLATIIASNYIGSDWKSSLYEGDILFIQYSGKMGIFIVHFDGSNNIFLIPNGTFTVSGTSSLTAYNGTSIISNPITWYGTATVSSGVATFYPTADGTASGTALFTNIHSVQAIAVNNTSSAIAYPSASINTVAANKKTITVNVCNGVNLGILGNTVVNAPNGTVVYLTLIGN